jgi:hypothetical protein
MEVDNVDIPPGSVIITPAELYSDVKVISTAVTDMRSEVREISKALPDHESRIRALERRIWWATGAAAGAAAGLSQLLQTLGKG